MKKFASGKPALRNQVFFANNQRSRQNKKNSEHPRVQNFSKNYSTLQ